MQSMIKNQYLFFISLIGIVLVSTIMITTYAYKTLRVDYVSGSKEEVSVSSGVLDVSFTISCSIDIKSMPLLPSYKTADYIEFNLDNTKSSSKVAYQISLVELDYSENIVDSYFRYTIVKVNNDNTLEELGNGTFANLQDNYITLYFNSGLYDYIDAGDNYNIRLYLWFKESKNVNQTNLLNTYFKGKVNVSSIFSSDVSLEKESNVFELGTLADKIVSNAMLGINGTIYSPISMTSLANDVSEKYESTLSLLEDNYYFRGDVKDNYINFNNMCFRIVRINSDGSIKLVLEDSNGICQNTNVTLDNNGLIKNENGIILVKNDYINKSELDGYLTKELNRWYELNNFGNLVDYIKLDTTCTNGTNSYKVLDLEKNMYVLRSNSIVYGNIDKNIVEMNEDNYKLQCNKNIENNNTISSDDTLYCNEWYYDINRRLYGKDKKISLSCNDSEKIESYINVLSADEVVLAGYIVDSEGNNYLSSSKNWWTSSISHVSLDKEYMFYVGEGLLTDNKDSEYGIRPTITLNNTVYYDSGDGTKAKPYEIKLINISS